MHVVLDTNIIYGSYFLNTPKFQALFKYLKDTKHTLFIPEIVLLEIKKNYSNEVKKFGQDIDKFNRVYVNEKINFDSTQVIESYERELEGLIKKHKIIIIKTESLSISVNELQKKFVLREKPLKESGAGYPDLMIWESVKNVFTKRTPSDYVAFITNNTSDFGNEQLHQSLLDEIQHNRERLLYFNSLESFLAEYEKPIEFINEDFIFKIYQDNKENFADILAQTPLDVQPEYSIEMIRDANFSGLEIIDSRLYNYYLYKADSEKFYISIELSLVLWMYVESEEFDGPAYSDVDIHFQIGVDKKTKKATVIEDYISISQ